MHVVMMTFQGACQRRQNKLAFSMASAWNSATDLCNASFKFEQHFWEREV